MIKEKLTFKLVSYLLSYPEDTFCESLDDVISLMDLVEEDVKPDFLQFFQSIQILDLEEWRRQYIQTFDFGRSTNLYVTYALHGEQRERGPALLKLKQLYKSEGFEVTDKELPDYLPVMLEFASANEDVRVGLELLNEYKEHLEAIKEGLQAANSFYVPLFDAILKTLEAVYEPMVEADQLEDVMSHG